jgi:hypothetical protein
MLKMDTRLRGYDWWWAQWSVLGCEMDTRLRGYDIWIMIN